jgi:hypothetical protein
LLHFFLSREKSGKHKLRRMIKRVKTPTAMLRQAQHDKAQEALQLAGKLMMKSRIAEVGFCVLLALSVRRGSG